MIKNYTNRIGELVASNKINEALKSLRDLFQNSPHLNKAIVQSARFNDLEEKVMTGVITE